MLWKLMEHRRAEAAKGRGRISDSRTGEAGAASREVGSDRRTGEAGAPVAEAEAGDIFAQAEAISRREAMKRDADSMQIVARDGGNNESLEERARRIVEQKALKIIPHDYDKKALKEIYASLKDETKDGRDVEFYHSAFGKNYRPDGLFAKIVPQLAKLFRQSEFAYSEMERPGGEIRRDGTVHKRHADIISRDNYVAKALIDEKEYFVRFNVQNKKSESGVHSTMVTNVDVYENPAAIEAVPTIHGGKINYDGIVDAKLREFFEITKENPEHRGDFLNEYRDSEEIRFRDGGEDERPLQERLTDIIVEMAGRHRDNTDYRDAAIEAIGNRMKGVNKARFAQRQYDRATIDLVTSTVKKLMANGLLDEVQNGEIGRLMSTIKHSLDNDEIEGSVRRLTDIVAENQLRLAGEMLDRITTIKGSKVDARGLEVAGRLDVTGQMTVRGFKEFRGQTDEQIDRRLADLEHKIMTGTEGEQLQAIAERNGIELAKRYRNEVAGSIGEQRELMDELAALKATWKDRKTAEERNQYRQEKQAIEDTLLKLKLDRAEATRAIASSMGMMVGESIERLKEFKETEKARIDNINHAIHSDLYGREEVDLSGSRKGVLTGLVNVAQLIMAPTATFEQMMRMLGSRSLSVAMKRSRRA